MMLARSGDRGEPWGVPSSVSTFTPPTMTPASRAADELEHPSVADPSGHAGHQGIVLNPVEEPVEIDIDDPGLPVFDCLPGGLHRLVGTPSRPEAEAPIRERWLEERTQDLAQRLLKKAVEHRRHA